MRKRKKKRGRPPSKINEMKLKQLAAIGAKTEDMARILGVSTDTIERRFRKEIDKAKAELRCRIKLAQIRRAEEGNPAMLIWLGKQCLGQKDEPGDDGGESGGAAPIPAPVIPRVDGDQVRYYVREDETKTDPEKPTDEAPKPDPQP